MYLSTTERRHVAIANGLADIHEDFCGEVLFSYWNSLKPLSPNNAGQILHSCRDPSAFLPVQHIRGCPVEPDLRERPWALRNWLYAMLREQGFRDRDFTSLSPQNISRWLDCFRSINREVENIENSEYKPFRKKNYEFCGAKWSTGKLITYADKTQRIAGLSCSESSCTKCCDADKRRTATRWVNKILSLSKVQNIGRFWTLVVTLPREVENMIPKGSNTRKKFMNELGKWVRKLFGLRAKDGLFFYANIHPVGDSDLMRDRFHVHMGVLPFAGRRLKGETHFFHCDVEDLIDTSKALIWLEAILKMVFPVTQRGKVQFKAGYIPLNNKSTIPRLNHRLSYDLRGFGKDVELAPLFFNQSSQLAVLRAGKNGYGLYTVEQIVHRWSWIRSQRDLRSYGLLKAWNKYAERLGVEYVEDPEPEIEKEELVVVKRTYGRQWNPKTKQVKWVNEKRAYWKKSGKEIEGIEWGRKGSEGFWRPLVVGPPEESHET
nr:hypothetical protein [Pseudodesulfovibrio sp.]